MNIFKKTFVATVLSTSLMGSFTSSAQEIERGNPFEAPSTWAEAQARQDERTGIIFKELEPKIKEAIFKTMSETQASLEIKLTKRIKNVADALNAANLARNTLEATAGNSDAAGEEFIPEIEEVLNFVIPQGSSFIACINQEALYRDNQNIIFKIPEADPQSIAMCSG